MSDDHEGVERSAGPIERLQLALTLRGISDRLGALEAGLSNRTDPAKGRWAPAIEILKIIFGGWPALALVFVLLFYVPLRDALTAIPEKVKGANEIAVLGMSLKTTLKAEAVKMGAAGLSETIPELPGGAIGLLLKAPSNHQSLVSYSPGADGRLEVIYFPSEAQLAQLSELERHRLIETETDGRPVSVSAVRSEFEAFRRTHGGKQAPETGDRLAWTPDRPLSRDLQFPNPSWKLSALGQQAVDLILRAVAAELTHR